MEGNIIGTDCDKVPRAMVLWKVLRAMGSMDNKDIDLKKRKRAETRRRSMI